MDKDILEKMAEYCLTYSYVLETDIGNINITTIFSTQIK